MKALILSFFLFIFSVQSTVSASEQSVESKAKFTVTTFNIAFYGLGGTPRGDSSTETRDPYLKVFFKDSMPASDIIVFQEIVDIPRLKTLIPENWDCLSYDNPSRSHQHVVLCHSSRFKFEKEPTDNNYLIDEVAGVRKTLRPAVTAIVTEKKSGKQLFRLVGVHLKATPEYSKTRQEQADIISKYLSKVEDTSLPVLITGDFNSYEAPANHETENDKDLMLKSFNNNNLEMSRIPNELYTFRDMTYGQSQFDQFYINGKLKATKSLNIYRVCNEENKSKEVDSELAIYNKTISDHCPVSAEISL